MEKAACKGTDPDDWFPLEYSMRHENQMTKICIEKCEVQAECLEYALQNVETMGIWGGFSAAELKGIRTKRFSRCKSCGRRWPKARLTKVTTCRPCRILEMDDKERREQ
jgi:WhiB family redox-sensing transcriptional regulator